MKKVILILFYIVSISVDAQIVDTLKKNESTNHDTDRKWDEKPSTFILPAALVTYGVSSFVIHPVRRIDYYFRDEIQKSAPNFKVSAENYFQFAPIAAVYGLNLIGVDGKHDFVDRTLLLGLSGSILALSGYTTKYATHRLRPNGADYLSFPSGHTSLVFMGAEYLAQEYGDKSILYPILGYTIAATTGVFRMYNRDHWFSDVVTGAGLGILSTKTAYLIYPYLRKKLTHKDDKGRSTSIIPTYQNGALGFSFAKQL